MTAYTTAYFPTGNYPTYDRRWLSNASVANEPRLVPRGTEFIGGTVKNSNGDTISGTTVYLYDATTGAMLAKTVSDSLGRWRFTGIDIGKSYRVITPNQSNQAESSILTFIMGGRDALGLWVQWTTLNPTATPTSTTPPATGAISNIQILASY